MPHFELRPVGSELTGARVDGALLRDLMNALVEGVRRATRLRIDGRSSAPGSPPGWLDSAAGFTVVGLREGSTVLDIEAPLLSHSVASRGGLGPLFEEPDADASAMSWFRESLEDALEGKAESDRFDGGLLDVFGEWRRVLERGVDRLELSNERGVPTVIDNRGISVVSGLKRATPPPQRVRVAGWLELIRHSDRAFMLKLEEGTQVRGLAAEVPVDRLRELFGRKATVSALAHFRPSGKVLRLDAEHIEPAGDDFSTWSREPMPMFGQPDQASLRVVQGPRSGVNAVFGQWPGDETDEEILRALEEMS